MSHFLGKGLEEMKSVVKGHRGGGEAEVEWNSGPPPLGAEIFLLCQAEGNTSERNDKIPHHER